MKLEVVRNEDTLMLKVYSWSLDGNAVDAWPRIEGEAWLEELAASRGI